MDCGMLLISKQTLYLINYGMMKIIMMIFYKEKFIALAKIKFIPEIFMFRIIRQCRTVNLNTFVFAEAKINCL